MAELLWKNMLVCAALEDQYLKDQVYKPNCKSVYQLNLPKKKKAFVLFKWIWGNELWLSSFINDGNNTVQINRFQQISRPGTEKLQKGRGDSVGNGGCC